jgi:simple sugar transport system ATP-binding protein
VENLWAESDKGLMALQGVSFGLREGEILGIAGVAGNGQQELVEVLTGLRQALRGKFFILGKEMTKASAKEIAETGVAHIPEHVLSLGWCQECRWLRTLSLKAIALHP